MRDAVMRDLDPLLHTVFRRETVRLCGIRQEPLESWIKDEEGHSVPDLWLNSLLMLEAFLQLLATGLGALILVLAATVVASTSIKKKDFWFITAIGIIQTTKVVSFISGPTVRFLVQFPAACIHYILISRRTRRGNDVGDVTVFVGGVSLVPVLFAAAPMVIATSCYGLSVFGLFGVQNYGDSDIDTRRGNIKPALIAFYSLVLAQGIVLLISCGVSVARLSATQRVRRDYFGIGNTDGIELMDRYITETQDKCIEKGVFSTSNRTLVSFAEELLQSEHRIDHVYAVSVLRMLTTRKERAAGAVEKIYSSEKIVGSLFKLLSPKSPKLDLEKLLRPKSPKLDLETKAETAEILTKLACNLRLTDIPGAAHSISSLLDPHPRLMKTAAKAGLPEPPAPPAPGVIAIWIESCLRKCMRLGADEAGAEPSSPAEETENHHKPLIVYGLMILDRLASDPGNCTEICKTTDLVPKILAPITHGLLNTLGSNDAKTIQIVKASLRVVAKLTSGTCESSSKLRRELISENSRTVRNIIWIMRNSSDEQEMRMLALEILTKLSLGQPMELVELMKADGTETSTEHRAATAEFLAQICAESRTCQNRMHPLGSVSNSLSEVLETIVTTEITDMTTERRKFLALFLGLAVQIRENLATTEDFEKAVRWLPVGSNMFCLLAEKLKEIIVEMTKEKESEDVMCLVITKAAAKLVTWTLSIDPVQDYAKYYFLQENIVDKLNGIVKDMGDRDLERCLVLRGDADEMGPYETLQTLVEKVKSATYGYGL